VATTHEHHGVARDGLFAGPALVLLRHAAESFKLLSILVPPPGPCSVHVVLTRNLYTGDVLVAPRYPVVVPWESGSGGRFKD
jgi:hypothetical protein